MVIGERLAGNAAVAHEADFAYAFQHPTTRVPIADHQTLIRVLIADDQALIREGLRALLSRGGFEIVGEAATGREVSQMAGHCRPDVVLMEILLPDMDGLAALAAIKRARPEIPVLVMSASQNAKHMLQAAAAGADGYLLKGIGREKLLQALRWASCACRF